jgi:hypothetical protein
MISALSSAHKRTGLLGLEEDILAQKMINVLGEQLKVVIPANVDAIHSMTLGDQRIPAERDNRDLDDVPRKGRLYYS